MEEFSLALVAHYHAGFMCKVCGREGHNWEPTDGDTWTCGCCRTEYEVSFKVIMRTKHTRHYFKNLRPPDDTRQEDEMEIPESPECAKMVALQEKSQVLTDFVDWLRDVKQLTLCAYITLDDVGTPRARWMPHMQSFEDMFAEFFGIDLDLVEIERAAILNAIREGD